MAKQMRLLKSEYNYLKKYDREFEAVRNDYLRPVGREAFGFMRGVYSRLYDREYNYSDSCNRCQLNLIRAILPAYDAAKKQYQ